VLATRTDPELPLSRLRVRGQLLEIRDRDLRFTGAETASFLTQGMGLALSREDVTTLEHRTEGWIAGLMPLPRPHSGTGHNRNVWRHSP